ncbi:MAG: hypothetical protein QF902_11635 [Rhodospirillales bacterium]|jgi:hypothetical protein|nr:hypothetical protein [Rhodospirillales bacterium]
MTKYPKIMAACVVLSSLLPIADGVSAGARAADRNPRLLGLATNRWIEIHQGPRDGWRREPHVGMAYDSKRGVLLFFGSGTHGRNWDNAVHAFDPVSERWTRHYRPADPNTYRADPNGRRIAGRGRILPWAMHAYDGIVYDPRRDAMIVAARPAHNPIRKKRPAAIVDPVWIYRLGTRRWRIMDNAGEPAPVVFAGGTAYDSHRDTIVLSRPYRRGGEVWELGPKRRKWVRVWRGRKQHGIHVNMGYDSRNRKIVVFGDYRATETVAVYTPGAKPGAPGSWEKRDPGGDSCPKVTQAPIAYSEKDGVFLVAPLIRETRETVTCVYDVATNRYRRIPDAPVGKRRMNFMMAYDVHHDVFLMVTGDWRAPPIVWAFKLDLDALD